MTMIWTAKLTPSETIRPTSRRLEPRICFLVAASSGVTATASAEELADTDAFMDSPPSRSSSDPGAARRSREPHPGTRAPLELPLGPESHHELRRVRAFLAAVPRRVGRAVLEDEAVRVVAGDARRKVEIELDPGAG